MCFRRKRYAVTDWNKWKDKAEKDKTFDLKTPGKSFSQAILVSKSIPKWFKISSANSKSKSQINTKNNDTTKTSISETKTTQKTDEKKFFPYTPIDHKNKPKSREMAKQNSKKLAQIMRYLGIKSIRKNDEKTDKKVIKDKKEIEIKKVDGRTPEAGKKIEGKKPEVVKKVEKKKPEEVVKKVEPVSSKFTDTTSSIASDQKSQSSPESQKKTEAKRLKDLPNCLLVKLIIRSRSRSPKKQKVKSSLKISDQLIALELKKNIPIIKVMRLKLPSEKIMDNDPEEDKNTVQKNPEPEANSSSEDDEAIAKQFWKNLHGVSRDKKLAERSSIVEICKSPIKKIHPKESIKSLDKEVKEEDILAFLVPSKKTDKTFNPYALRLSNDSVKKEDFASGVTFQRSNFEDTLEWERLYKEQTKHRFKFELVDQKDLNPIEDTQNIPLETLKSIKVVDSDYESVQSAKSKSEKFVIKAIKIDDSKGRTKL